jgi:hypothetical protein
MFVLLENVLSEGHPSIYEKISSIAKLSEGE